MNIKEFLEEKKKNLNLIRSLISSRNPAESLNKLETTLSNNERSPKVQ
jgi:hypothetical protein